MKGNKYNSMLKANILLERNFIYGRNIIKESNGEMDSKKQTMISNLETLKKDNATFSTKFDKHINALKSADVTNACEGNKLKADLQSKLSDAKSDLSMKALLKDPNKVIPKLEEDIKFIESYCSTKGSSTTSSSTSGGSLPPPVVGMTGDTIQNKQSNTINQPPKSDSKQEVTVKKDIEDLKQLPLRTALETLRIDNGYSKDDAINYFIMKNLT